MVTVDEWIKILNPSQETMVSAVGSLSDDQKNIYALIEIEKMDMESVKLVTGLAKDVIRVKLIKAKKSVLGYILHNKICRYSQAI